MTFDIECCYAECLYAECCYSECHALFIIMLNVILLSVVILNVMAPLLDTGPFTIKRGTFCPGVSCRNTLLHPSLILGVGVDLAL
jgi:hypothetical protein